MVVDRNCYGPINRLINSFLRVTPLFYCDFWKVLTILAELKRKRKRNLLSVLDTYQAMFQPDLLVIKISWMIVGFLEGCWLFGSVPMGEVPPKGWYSFFLLMIPINGYTCSRNDDLFFLSFLSSFPTPTESPKPQNTRSTACQSKRGILEVCTE